MDSLRAATVVSATDRTAYDLGSGAGLPGVVVAIACPELVMTLVESRRPRAAFLQLVLDRLELTNGSVSNVRVETLDGPVDLCFSRAFARVGVAWQAADRLLAPGGSSSTSPASASIPPNCPKMQLRRWSRRLRLQGRDRSLS